MISTQTLMNTLDEIRKITGTDLAVFDPSGHPVYISDASAGKVPVKEIAAFANTSEESSAVQGIFLAKNVQNGSCDYVIAAAGGKEPELVAKLAAFQIESLAAAYRERLDKDEFIKNLLLDNLLLVDIYSRAKKFDIPISAARVAIIVESPAETGKNSIEQIESLFSGRDFVTAVDNHGIIILKELFPEEGYETAQKAAEDVFERLGRDENIRIAFGTIVPELKDISRSFKEARMAIDVGKIFSPEKNIVAYSSLGIGRLIYQLPVPLCRMFIREIFANRSPEQFDEEILTTIRKFFENNLNVSETSRQLYIHRNTLVYRLDKIQKMTGLDLRVFEDAITFRIALMVVRYMKYMENQER